MSEFLRRSPDTPLSVPDTFYHSPSMLSRDQDDFQVPANAPFFYNEHTPDLSGHQTRDLLARIRFLEQQVAEGKDRELVLYKRLLETSLSPPDTKMPAYYPPLSDGTSSGSVGITGSPAPSHNSFGPSIGASIPHVYPPALIQKKDCPGTKHFAKSVFYDKIKIPTPTTFGPVIKPLNQSAYLEDENGTVLGPGAQKDIFAAARGVWHFFAQQGALPDRFTSATTQQINYFRSIIGTQFPVLLRAESYWKIDRIWSTQYSSWYKHRNRKELVKSEANDNSLSVPPRTPKSLKRAKESAASSTQNKRQKTELSTPSSPDLLVSAPLPVTVNTPSVTPKVLAMPSVFGAKNPFKTASRITIDPTIIASKPVEVKLLSTSDAVVAPISPVATTMQEPLAVKLAMTENESTTTKSMATCLAHDSETTPAFPVFAMSDSEAVADLEVPVPSATTSTVSAALASEAALVFEAASVPSGVAPISAGSKVVPISPALASPLPAKTKVGKTSKSWYPPNTKTPQFRFAVDWKVEFPGGTKPALEMAWKALPQETREKYYVKSSLKQ